MLQTRKNLYVRVWIPSQSRLETSASELFKVRNLFFHILFSDCFSLGEQINVIARMLQNLPSAHQLKLKLNDILMKQITLNVYYREMERYLRHIDKYENSALINFAEGVVSGDSNSIPFLMESVYQQVTVPGFFDDFLEGFDVSSFNTI